MSLIAAFLGSNMIHQKAKLPGADAWRMYRLTPRTTITVMLARLLQMMIAVLWIALQLITAACLGPQLTGMGKTVSLQSADAMNSDQDSEQGKYYPVVTRWLA